MNKSDIIKEAHVGQNVQFDNLELVLIKSKWESVLEGLFQDKEGNVDLTKKHISVDTSTAKKIEEFHIFIGKLCGQKIDSIQDIERQLFTDMKLSEGMLEQIVEAT